MSTLLQSRWAPQPSSEQTASATTTATAGPDAKEEQVVERTTPASTLSAVANEFSPATMINETSTFAVEFSQTGTQEDALFDDAITYESMQTRSQDDLFGDDFTPAQAEDLIRADSGGVEHEPQPVKQQQQQQQQRRTDTRERGRGKMGARNVQRETNIRSQASAPENAPAGPKKETQPAVRGDRFATGGVKKPKLSEAELSEKLAQISIKNASLTAAHARAEADAASFEQREAQAKVDATQRSEAAKARAREERRDRQQMIGEREKNRMRKLKAMEGREWDQDKKEDDFAKGGRFDKKGAFAGDQDNYTDGREYLLKEPRNNAAAAAAAKSDRSSKPLARTNAPTKDDFPALPSQPADFHPNRQLGNEAVKSWAEQVESSV